MMRDGNSANAYAEVEHQGDAYWSLAAARARKAEDEIETAAIWIAISLRLGEWNSDTKH
jgi:hypothetical protein